MTRALVVFEKLLRAVRQSESDRAPDAFLAARRELLAATAAGEEPHLDLLREVPAAEGLRRLAMALNGQDGLAGAARAAIVVALQLRSDDVAIHKSCGLIAMSALTPLVARGAFRRAADSGDAQGEVLLRYCEVAFPAADFADARPEGGTGSSTVARSLTEVRRQVQVYATRLQRHRERLLEANRHAAGDWLVPELGHVLPRGPVALKAWRYSTAPGGEGPPEVSVAESPADLKPLGTQHQARGDWAALAWLCWLVGLDTVALPTALSPREAVGACVDQARALLDACRERAGGAHVATDLRWRGHAIAALPPSVAALAARDAAELLAVARWLTTEAVQSPFAEGLRA